MLMSHGRITATPEGGDNDGPREELPSPAPLWAHRARGELLADDGQGRARAAADAEGEMARVAPHNPEEYHLSVQRVDTVASGTCESACHSAIRGVANGPTAAAHWRQKSNHKRAISRPDEPTDQGPIVGAEAPG